MIAKLESQVKTTTSAALWKRCPACGLYNSRPLREPDRTECIAALCRAPLPFGEWEPMQPDGKIPSDSSVWRSKWMGVSGDG